MNKNDRLISRLAGCIAAGLHEHLLSDDAFVDALHTSVADYVGKQGVFADDVEVDVAMDLVQRVIVLQDNPSAPSFG